MTDDGDYLVTIRKRDIIDLVALHDLSSDDIVKALTIGLKDTVEFFLNGLSDVVIEKRKLELTRKLKEK